MIEKGLATRFRVCRGKVGTGFPTTTCVKTKTSSASIEYNKFRRALGAAARKKSAHEKPIQLVHFIAVEHFHQIFSHFGEWLAIGGEAIIGPISLGHGVGAWMPFRLQISSSIGL